MNSDKWKCVKCSTINIHPRCSWCSAPRPLEDRDELAKKHNASTLTESLHRAIDQLSPQSKKAVWRWMEDNVL